MLRPTTSPQGEKTVFVKGEKTVFSNCHDFCHKPPHSGERQYKFRV